MLSFKGVPHMKMTTRRRGVLSLTARFVRIYM